MLLRRVGGPGVSMPLKGYRAPGRLQLLSALSVEGVVSEVMAVKAEGVRAGDVKEAAGAKFIPIDVLLKPKAELMEYDEQGRLTAVLEGEPRPQRPSGCLLGGEFAGHGFLPDLRGGTGRVWCRTPDHHKSESFALVDRRTYGDLKQTNRF